MIKDNNRMRKRLLRSGPVYRVDHTIQGAKGSMIPRAYHSKLYKSRVISGPLVFRQWHQAPPTILGSSTMELVTGSWDDGSEGEGPLSATFIISPCICCCCGSNGDIGFMDWCWWGSPTTMSSPWGSLAYDSGNPWIRRFNRRSVMNFCFVI